MLVTLVPWCLAQGHFVTFIGGWQRVRHHRVPVVGGKADEDEAERAKRDAPVLLRTHLSVMVNIVGAAEVGGEGGGVVQATTYGRGQYGWLCMRLPAHLHELPLLRRVPVRDEPGCPAQLGLP